MAQETLLVYPDFNKEFHIYTDAKKDQLGAVIVQDRRPIAFLSWKELNPAQPHHTVTKRELLSIVEVLKRLVGTSYWDSRSLYIVLIMRSFPKVPQLRQSHALVILNQRIQPRPETCARYKQCRCCCSKQT